VITVQSVSTKSSASASASASGDSSATAEASQDFNIKPGFDDTVSVTAGKVTCSFSYSCNGGTNENWSISISNDNGDVTCFIGRPTPPSYLVFNSFTASLKGATILSTSIEGLDGPLTSGSDFIVKKNKVEPGETFKSNIGLITMTGREGARAAKKPKTDL